VAPVASGSGAKASSSVPMIAVGGPMAIGWPDLLTSPIMTTGTISS
jgi:hypothetical protein